MTPKEINQAITIATRFAELQEAAKQVRNSIITLGFNFFADTVSADEKEILKKAAEIATRIADNHGSHDAVKCFQKIQDEQK